jgi:hypothetical protein
VTRFTYGAIVTGFLIASTLSGASVVSAQQRPLFPRHHRGLYINNDNVEVIDATPQSPPLEVDDPSVPDEGEYEINLLTGVDFTKDMRHVDVFTADANYGIVIKGFNHELPTQVKFEMPVVAVRETDNPYTAGLGNAAFGLKFNFYNDDSRGLRVAVYPQVEASTAANAAKGLADPGETLIVPLLVSHESKYLTWDANAGFGKSFHAPGREAEVNLAFGAGRPFFRKLAIMGDLSSTSNVGFRHDRLIAADAGFIYGVRKAIWYGRLGHSVFSDDGPHAYAGFGMKVLFN